MIKADTLNAINGAKSILSKRFNDYFTSDIIKHTKYSTLYFWTNENINAYLSLFPMEMYENALSVLSSGDHIFNLIQRGILDIDTFDSNLLTEYYALGLKKAMILKYSYKDFIKYMNKICGDDFIRDEELYEIIKGLFPYMERRYQIFWNALINYDYYLRKDTRNRYNLIELLVVGDYTINSNSYNSFLISEENYNMLKNYLSKANITFTYANAKDLSYIFDNKKYDLLLLSNILDYFHGVWGNNWSYEDLKKYEDSLVKLMSKNGIIFLKYVYHYLHPDLVSNPISSTDLFSHSDFSLKSFTDEELFVLPKAQFNISKDAIILKRVK